MGQRLHQSCSFGDEPKRVVSGEDPSEARGHVLAHRMADHAVGLDAEPAPSHCQGVLDDEQRGLGDRRLSEPLFREPFAPGLWVEHVAQLEAELGSQNRRALVDIGAKGGIGLVEPARHPHGLRALTGEQERNRRIFEPARAVERGCGVGVAKPRDGLDGSPRHDRPTV